MAHGKTDRPVVITTKHNGVFFGWIKVTHLKELALPCQVRLADSRNAWRWQCETGFQELATVGPGKGSKVGATAPVAYYADATSLLECTDEAAQAWEAAAWEP